MEALRQQPVVQAEQSQALVHLMQLSRQLLQQPLERQQPSLQALAATVVRQLAALMMVHREHALSTKTQGLEQVVQVVGELHCWQLMGQAEHSERAEGQNSTWQVEHSVDEEQVWHWLGQGRQLVLEPEGHSDSCRRGQLKQKRTRHHSIISNKLIYLKQSLLRILQKMKTAITPRWKQFHHPPHPDHPESRDKFRSHSKSRDSKPSLVIRTSSSKHIPLPPVPLDPKRLKPNDKSKEVQAEYSSMGAKKKETVANGTETKEITAIKKQLEGISCKASQNQKALLSAAAVIAEKYHFKLLISQTHPTIPSIQKIPGTEDHVKEEHSITSTQCSAKREEGGSSKTVASSSSLSESSSKKDRITNYYFHYPSH